MRLSTDRLRQVIAEELQEAGKKSSSAADRAKELNNETQQWLDDNPGGWASTLPEDQNHWSDLGVETAEDLDLHLLKGNLWDFYKEVHGIRPRHIDFDNLSLEDAEDLMSDLEATAEAQIEAVKDQEIWDAEQAEQAELEQMRVPEPGSHLPPRAGMGKRPPEKNVRIESRRLREQDPKILGMGRQGRRKNEGTMRITETELRQIVLEELEASEPKKEKLHLTFNQRHRLTQKIYNEIIRYLKDEKMGINRDHGVDFEQGILKLIEVVDKILV